jgi:hypothetical protein
MNCYIIASPMIGHDFSLDINGKQGAAFSRRDFLPDGGYSLG